jgi:hypothetical protein
MKPSTELFSLIQTLTKSEKRFFKLNSSLQSGEKNYLKLFDFIEKQSNYNEEELKKYFSTEKFIQHLPSEKNHLYKLVLKSLRAYYSDQSVKSQLKQDIKNVEILYQKALYKECAKFVKRAKKTAADYEKFYYLFELIAWEKKLIEEDYEEGLFNHNLDELIEEERRVIEQLRNLAEYHILYSKINYVFRSGGFTRNEAERMVVEEISEYHLIKGKNTAISVRATSICYYIQGLCAASNRDYETALINFRKTKAILEKNTKIKSDLPNRYIYTLTFLLHCYLDSNDFNNAEKTYTQLCELSDKKEYKSLDSEVKIFSAAAIGKMQILTKQGKFSKALEAIPEIDSKVEKYADKLNKEKILLIDYSKAYVYFGIGDFKQSLKLINGVLNDNEKELRQDVYSFARIFNLVIHFELGNYDFIEYESKSTSRYLNKHEKDYQIEKVFMKYIKKIAKEDFGPDKKIIFEDFYAEVEELMKDPSEQVILEYFDVKSWLYSKVKRKDFAAVLQSAN